MIICDTNIIIELLKGRPPVAGILRTVGLPNLAISTVTKAELIFGALNKNDLAFIQKGIKLLQAFPINEAIGETAIHLMESYSLSNRLSLPDALIAATALHQGLPLFTLNKKDFRYIPDLTLYEPS